jgi:two-component sensor histidine kinase
VITVSLNRKEDNKLSLLVKDNGIGKQDDEGASSGTSFGSRLIHLLSLQLNGKLSADYAKGTAVQLLFNEIS